MEGKDHKHAKQKFADKMLEKGYDVDQEHRLQNGMIVDVYAENDEETVAVEIGSLNGEDRITKLKQFADRVVHIPQFGKPNSRKGDYTTVSFRKDFIEELKVHMEAETHYDSVKSFLKHLAVKDMESDEKISSEEAKEIYQKLEDLGYLDR